MRATLLALALLAAACANEPVAVDAPTTSVVPTTSTAASPTSSPPTTETTTTTAPTTTTDPHADLRAAIGELTAEELVGQLLMPLIWGVDATDPSAGAARRNMTLFGVPTAAEVVADWHLAGVVLLGHNISDAASTTAFTTALADAEPGLLVAVDQEGGRVARLSDGVPDVPAAGTLSDPDEVEALAVATAEAARAQGFHVVFAPVADVAETGSFLGDRSYGSDPESTSALVAAAVRGLQAGGVAASAKHWPGHGHTTVDSHDSLPVVDRDLAVWEQTDLPPFRAALAEDVATVMVGHLAYPALDPSGDPATVSAPIVARLRELGFDGVVITDALDMGALSSLDPGEVAVRAVEADIDLLLAPPEPMAARAALLAALAEGRLTRERLERSALRTWILKERLGVLP